MLLPRIALGIWNNFGSHYPLENQREMLLTAFNLGITHIDAANNYGPPPGSAEEALGKIMDADLAPFRDELIITTKAGYKMWDGPYGNWGSRKYLMASLHQSLRRMHLDYVDIFYHHRRDTDTPLEETMSALADIVHQGKALYVGISNYEPEDSKQASHMLKKMGVPLLIHQHRYNMFERKPEDGLHETLRDEGIGAIAFCPLAQGILTDKYLNDIPVDSRAANQHIQSLNQQNITPAYLEKIKALNKLALARGQTLAQMALIWAIRPNAADFAIIGARCAEQIVENVKSLECGNFTQEELNQIDHILGD